ncbi:MAG TPA: TIGR03621 family F420-dependent LLM class oxidoreductase [Ilumatobacter sp.]|nr:TIGR03621 family F420-dependent LLM class oxidoreductase [Ilumatobacter sp.]
MTYPIRFGVAGGASLTSAAEIADVVGRAEAAGFTSFTVNDHLASNLSPFPALTVAAEASETMLLGTLVLANDFRHPVMLAKEAATLDVLSGGRVELGIGAGWADDDYDQMGIPKAVASTRISRMADAVTILRGMWSGEPFSFESEHYRVTDVVGLPSLTRSTIPICVGGGGERVLTYAGRHADIVGINLNFASGQAGVSSSSTGTAELTEQRVNWATAAAAAAGRDVELQCRVHVAAVIGDAPAAAQLLEQLAGRMGLGIADLLASPHNLIGSADEIVAKIRHFADTLGITYWVIPHDQIGQFAPIIAELVG